MFHVKDPPIKLFGRDIHINTPIKQNQAHIADSNSPTQIQPQPITMNGFENSTSAEEKFPMEEACSKQTDPKEDANSIPNMNKNSTQKLAAKVFHRTDDHSTSTRDINQEKVLKKPDKVLPCPRCNSLETKFCYFNNYNVNQPRHFCKNCQRYWTAGGTIRNVPVGAGKRKNKHSPLQFYQVAATSDDAVHGMQTDSNPVSDMHLLPVTSRPLKEAPLSESLENMLNLKGHTKIEVDSSAAKDDYEDPSSSSIRSAESMEKECSENGIEQVGLTQHCNGLIPLHPLHYYPVPSWAYEWNPCWNAMAFRPSPAYMGSATMIAIPGFSTPTVELPVSPSSYWGSMPSWAEQKDESSLVGSTFSGMPSPSSSVSNNSTCSGNMSPTLGKHSRDGSTQAEDTVTQNLWVPKTLRISDPEEAAKSSIWTTLATKSKQNKPIMKGSVFKSFEPKSNGSSHVLEDNQILRANPAAFSRSESFQESL